MQSASTQLPRHIRRVGLPKQGPRYISQARPFADLRLSTPKLKTEPQRAVLKNFKMNFTTSSSRMDPTKQNDSGRANPDKKPDTVHEDIPSVSLQSLGIGKNMRMFLFGVLCIFGTIETWFWCKAIWIWWKSRQDDDASSQT